MNNFNNDNVFSDQCINSECLNKHIKKSGIFKGDYFYKDMSGTNLDIDNNIDGYLNGIPVQMHMQRIENVKGSINNYHAFIKYKRNKTGAKTELYKVINNKKKKDPYPKYIIWAIIDPYNNILHKIEIIDVDLMLKNLEKNKIEYKKIKKLDKIDDIFYKKSKYYKTYYNPIDGTEPLYLISEKPLYEYTFNAIRDIPFNFD